MSNFEKLPTELLLEIFLYSLNLDLPRSSPVIGGKLTSEITYIQLIAAAFHPTWEDGYGKQHPKLPLTETTDIDEGPRTDHRPFGVGDGDLQSAILRCRWASLPILQKCQELWIEKHAKDRAFHPLPFVYNTHVDAEDLIRKQLLQRQLTPKAFFDEDFAAFSNFEGGNSDGDLSFQWYTYADVSKDLEIPQSLLLGPWDQEKTKFLFWLVKGGAQLEWLNSTSGEAAMLGLKNAIVSGNVQVLHLLTWAGLRERIDIEILVWAIKNAAKDRISVVHSIYSKYWIFHSLGIEEEWQVSKALGELRDQAKVDGDPEAIEFVREVQALLRIKE